MKKFLLLPLVAFVMASCSETASDNGHLNEGDENVARNYLSLSLITPKSGFSRDLTSNDFENGTNSENYVNAVRFFFFDDQGNAVVVNDQTSFIDWVPSPGDQQDVDDVMTVEKIVTANIGINPPNGSNLPSLVLAVINPPSAVLSLNNPSLGQLQGLTADYLSGLTNNNFVITNSVYVNLDGSEVIATAIPSSSIADTAEDAQANPVQIYVERVVSRLDFTIGITGSIIGSQGSPLYPIGSFTVSDSASTTTDSIYARFLGWNITQTPNKSRLIKSINPDWPTGLFGVVGEPWNTSDYRRSFWAINPPISEFEYLYGNFGETPDPSEGSYDPAQAEPIPLPGAWSTIYLQENAADYTTASAGTGPTYPTQLIIAAQLVNSGEEPMSIAWWANRYYTLQGLLNAIANSLNLYQMTRDPGATTYTKITPDDIQLVSAAELFPDGESDVPRYYTYVQLSKAAEGITWYLGSAQGTAGMNTEQVNQYLIDYINDVLVWSSGYTYYYITLRHLGAEGFPGYYGIVRNHLYKATLTGIPGLGTPVFNPDQVIYPDTPTPPSGSSITVDIQILQWRIVSQDYTITWP